MRISDWSSDVCSSDLAEGEEIVRRAPSVDVVVGPQAYHRLPELIRQAGERRAIDTDMPPVSKFDALPKRSRQGASAFLTVQEGCDKFCTYSVVPYTRGAEVSRSRSEEHTSELQSL